jgi:hypothetical protein
MDGASLDRVSVLSDDIANEVVGVDIICFALRKFVEKGKE